MNFLLKLTFVSVLFVGTSTSIYSQNKLIKAIEGVNTLFTFGENIYNLYEFLNKDKTSNSKGAKVAISTNSARRLTVYFNGQRIGKINKNKSIGLDVQTGRINVVIKNGNQIVFNESKSVEAAESYHFQLNLHTQTELKYISSDRVNTNRAVINDPDGYTNVREGRSTATKIIFKIYDHQQFNVIYNSTSNWWYIIMDDGRQGYMHKSRIRVLN